MEEESDILSYENLFSLELYNTSSFILNNMENAEILYDRMMRKGMRIGCHAGDDNHNRYPFDDPNNDSCGWYTVLLCDDLSYKSAISALEKKDCYASNGPRFHEIAILDGVMGKTVHIECSPASKVFVHYGSKAPNRERLPKGKTKTVFDFPLHPNADYFRVTVYDEKGQIANSRGFFRDEWER